MTASFASHRIGMGSRWQPAVIVLLLVLFQDFTGASDIYSTLSLRKCYCDKFQAWSDGACRDNITTVLPIYQQDFDGTQKNVIDVKRFGAAHPTSLFKNVTVQDVQCPEGLYRTTLIEDILLLPDGRLLWLRTNSTLPKESFCVVHNLVNEVPFFDAHVCLPPPTVPRCCPANHFLGEDGSCYPHEPVEAPPILVGAYEVDWDSLGGDMTSLACEDYENFRYVHLREREGQLRYTSPVAELHWNLSLWTATQDWAHKYCVAMQEEDGDLQYTAQICFKDYARYHDKQCGDAACVRKCCPENTLIINGRCFPASSEEEVWHPSRLPNQTVNEEWKIVTGEPGCYSYVHRDAVHILPNGFLQLAPEVPVVSPSHYCLDYHLDPTQGLENVALICFLEVNNDCLWRDTLVKVLKAVSCVFLVLTLAVYLFVAELRDQMYGRCLVSMVAAMLTAYISFIVDHQDFSRASCFVKALIAHFSSLAVFFWLNVMCFDMWKILRGSLRQTHSIKVFLGYCLYAWGCPLVISVITLVLDVIHPAGTIILPEYNDGSCWFNGNIAYWLYFSGFILILVLINAGYFIHVAITLAKKMKERSREFGSTTSHTNKVTKSKQRMWLYVKLFLVMGVLWIADSLSAVAHRRTCTYWVVTDVINALQGVFIFIVAVCNKDNLKKIKEAWEPRFKVVCKNIPNLTSRRSTQTNTQSISETEDSRKTSITSLPQKISQASCSLFNSTKKSATLYPTPDSSTDPHNGRKGSNVSIKDVIPLANMEE